MECPWRAWGWGDAGLRVADVVYAQHPEWQRYAVPHEWTLAKISSDAPTFPPLEFRLDGLTVLWGEWHTEYERFPGDEEAIVRALETIEGILEERLALALGTRANGRLGAVRLLPIHPERGVDLEDYGAPSGRIGCAEAAGDFVRWEVLSWRGTYTQTYFPPPSQSP